MTAPDWGFDISGTEAKLMEVSTKAKKNGPRYAALTAQNAAAQLLTAIDRRGEGADFPRYQMCFCFTLASALFTARVWIDLPNSLFVRYSVNAL
jgi:hypothetical protein